MTGDGKEEQEVTLIVVVAVTVLLENQGLCYGEGFTSGFDFGLGIYVEMGCSGSKVDDLPLVIRCRDRKDLIRATADHRYALAAAHVAYFHSMKDVGDALRRFVEEELILAASASSTPSTTSSSGLTLHSVKDNDEPHEAAEEEEEEEGPEDVVVEDKKINEPHRRSGKNKSKSRNRSINKGGKRRDGDDSGTGNPHLHHTHSDDDSDSHLHLSSSESDVSPLHHVDDDGGYEHMHIHHDPDPGHYPGPGPGLGTEYGYGYGYVPGYGGYGMPDPAGQGAYSGQFPGYFGMNQPYQAWDANAMEATGMNFQNNSHFYYMRNSSPAVKTVIHRPEPVMNGYTNPYYGYPMPNEGFYGGYPPGPPPEKEKPAAPPPPPSPKASAWDFFNPFDEYGNGYLGHEYGYSVGHEYVASSPDSTEVRMREGIPDLEEETEYEPYKKSKMQSAKSVEGKRMHSSDGKTATTSGAGGYRTSHKRSEEGKRMHSADGKTASTLGAGYRASSSLHKRNDEGKRRMHSEWSEDQQNLDSFPGSGSFPMPRKDEGSSSSDLVSLHKSSSEDSRKIMPMRKGIGRGLNSSKNGSKKIPVSHYRRSMDKTDDSRAVPTEKSENFDITEDDSSQEIMASLKSPVDMYVRKKGVSFEVDETIKSDVESSKASSFATFSVHGSRDLREVVTEIRDEFAAAYDNGKEVAVMLDVGKLPYQPNIIKVILSRMLYLISPSLSSSYSPSMRSMRVAAKTMKLAKSYFGDDLKDFEAEPCNLLSTLEKLYEWEKKLYKEVKNEEGLRVAYDKLCKRLKSLDERGAESSKIDAVRSSKNKMQTRLNVSIKSIKVISDSVQRLRDEELHPQVAKLIYGMIRMWRSMLRCHQKQFQAIKESKLLALRAKTDLQKDSTLRATCDLENELRLWCGHFNNWISTQKAYVESLNEWLMLCLGYEPEQSADGPVPFSPGRLGAPPIFVICHDWKLAMEMISETGVANALNTFASSLHNFWEKQDEEQRQRLIADDLSAHFRDRLSGGAANLVASAAPMDDLKVDLDTVQKKLAEERAKHKDTIKILNYAASSSVQGGLVPIFKALERFSMEALKAHEKVRLHVDEDEDEHR